MIKRTLIALSLILLVALPLAFSLKEDTALQEAKVSPYVLDSLKNQETVEVEIYLENPRTKEYLTEQEKSSLTQNLDQEKIIKTFEEGVIASLTQEEIQSLSNKKEVSYISPRILIKPTLDESVDIIDAELAWEKEINGISLDASGQTVCVIDTGVDFNHPDLEEKNIAGGNFDCTAGASCPLASNNEDWHSHGTHVAGTIAAVGDVITGVGKGANIISMRVFPEGDDTIESFLIKRGLQGCLDKAEEFDVSVITASIGSDFAYSDYCDWINSPVTNAVNTAFDQEIPVTFAAGNLGTGGTSYPGCIQKAIPVGGTDKNDYLGVYSNHNPNLQKVFAPGTAIYSTCLDNGYCTKTGTSMATPMVAAANAILKQFLEETEQTMNPHEIEDLLFQTGSPVLGTPLDFKRININDALNSLDTFGPEISLNSPSESSIINLPERGGYNFLASASDWQEITSLEFNIYKNLANSPDVDQTGVVDIDDSLKVILSWGACNLEFAGRTCPTDIDGDLNVDDNDLDLVQEFWGTDGSGLIYTSTINPQSSEIENDFYVPKNTLEVGEYIWSITAIDALGNQATESSYFTVQEPASTNLGTELYVPATTQSSNPVILLN